MRSLKTKKIWSLILSSIFNFLFIICHGTGDEEDAAINCSHGVSSKTSTPVTCQLVKIFMASHAYFLQNNIFRRDITDDIILLFTLNKILLTKIIKLFNLFIQYIFPVIPLLADSDVVFWRPTHRILL
jgi:hypothetical protein